MMPRRDGGCCDRIKREHEGAIGADSLHHFIIEVAYSTMRVIFIFSCSLSLLATMGKIRRETGKGEEGTRERGDGEARRLGKADAAIKGDDKEVGATMSCRLHHWNKFSRARH